MTAQGSGDRTVVVIGAANGIGASVASRLAGEHARLVLSDFRGDALRQTVAAVANGGHRTPTTRISTRPTTTTN